MPKPIPIPAPVQEIPKTLKPFTFHGLPLNWQGKEEATCDCPSCGRGDARFSVNTATGLYKCFGCDFRGGSTTFLRWLWAESDKATRSEDYDSFAADRKLQYPDTLMHWGCCRSLLTGAWLVPGFNPEGELTQLYKRIPTADRWELRPTPEAGGHALSGVQLFSKSCDTVYLTEGPWDGMVLWELLRTHKIVDNHLEFTGNSEASLLAPDAASVLSVANCGAVGDPFARFLPLLSGKRVVLCFDNDHPRDNNGSLVDGAAFGATKRAAAMLTGVAREVCWLRWGDVLSHGADLSKPDGYDVKDLLTREAA